MGIRLDWEIDADQEQIRSAGEDPEAKRRRRRARARFFLVLLVMLSFIAVIIAGVALRLRQVDWQIEQMLRDTIEAEVAALRVGDQGAFLSIQRSASEDWLQRQARMFEDYQALKVEHDVNLTGRVLDVTIDRLRARATVEEIIDGIPYGRVWFYWRYADDDGDENNDGWRHVPPDYTFWGSPATYQAQMVTVNYGTVDAPVAQAVGNRLAEWITTGCAALGCGTLPELTVDIIPDETIQRVSLNGGALQLRSPFIEGARLDMPFDEETQQEIAPLLSEQLVTYAKNTPFAPTADAIYLRSSLVRWLEARFMGRGSGDYLISTLAANYGDAAVSRLVQAMQADSSIRVLNEAANVDSLDRLSVDWRDFLTWRLALENELIQRRDEAGLLGLYDTRDENTRNLAIGRFNAGTVGEAPTVTSIRLEADANGTAQLRAQTQSSVETGEVIFRLVDGVWRRAS